MSDLGFLPRMLAIKLKHFDVYNDDMPIHVVEGYIREIITAFNANDLKNKKYEEIKEKAFKIYKTANEILIEKNDQPAIYRDIPLWEQAWNLAERFYTFAKQKQEEASDEL